MPISLNELKKMVEQHISTHYGQLNGRDLLLQQIKRITTHALAWANLSNKTKFEEDEIHKVLGSIDTILAHNASCPSFLPNISNDLLKHNVPPGKQHYLAAIKALLNNTSGKYNYSEAAKIFFKGSRSETELKLLRECIQLALNNIGEHLTSPKTTRQQQWLLEVNISMLLSFYTFMAPPRGSDLVVPQYIDGRWIPTTYSVEPLLLNPDDIQHGNEAIYAYGLSPAKDTPENVKPWLLFRGTPPTNDHDGHIEAIDTDFAIDMSPGETLMMSGLPILNAWVDAQTKKVRIAGHSLGGSCGLLYAYARPEKVERLDAIDPPGTKPETLERNPFRNWSSTDSKPTVRIFQHAGDPISATGQWPEEAEDYLVLSNKAKITMAHVINYYGQSDNAILRLHTATDNNSPQRKVFSQGDKYAVAPALRRVVDVKRRFSTPTINRGSCTSSGNDEQEMVDMAPPPANSTESTARACMVEDCKDTELVRGNNLFDRLTEIGQYLNAGDDINTAIQQIFYLIDQVDKPADLNAFCIFVGIGKIESAPDFSRLTKPHKKYLAEYIRETCLLKLTQETSLSNEDKETYKTIFEKVEVRTSTRATKHSTPGGRQLRESTNGLSNNLLMQMQKYFEQYKWKKFGDKLTAGFKNRFDPFCKLLIILKQSDKPSDEITTEANVSMAKNLKSAPWGGDQTFHQLMERFLKLEAEALHLMAQTYLTYIEQQVSPTEKHEKTVVDWIQTKISTPAPTHHSDDQHSSYSRKSV